jgi:hypothetical protein
MNNFIKNVLEKNPLDKKEVFSFIEEYCKLKNKPVDSIQLEGIFRMLQMGVFTLDNAVKDYAYLNNLQITTITDMAGIVLNVEVKEITDGN